MNYALGEAEPTTRIQVSATIPGTNHHNSTSDYSKVSRPTPLLGIDCISATAMSLLARAFQLSQPKWVIARLRWEIGAIESNAIVFTQQSMSAELLFSESR